MTSEPIERYPTDKPWHTTYFGLHYLVIYSRHLLSPMETGWEAEFIGTALELKVRAKILDVPCGFGRHLMRLARAGYQPVGIDLQIPYLMCARSMSNLPEKGPVPVAAADMGRLPFKSESFDAVANIFNSFGYFSDDAEAGVVTNCDLMAEFARVLKPGGKILIDVPERDALIEAISDQPQTRCGADGWEIKEQWRYDEETKRIHNHTIFALEDQTHECGYDVRLYTREELEKVLSDAGLTPWKFWSELHRDADETSGDRLVIAARKQ